MDLVIDLFVEKSFLTGSCEVLSIDLTINLKSFIIPLVFGNLFHFVSLLEQNTTKKRQEYGNIIDAKIKTPQMLWYTSNLQVFSFYD